MKTRTHDDFYDHVKARVEGLSDQQFLNVQQRLRTIKAIVPNEVLLMAIDSLVDIELNPASPPPPPCPIVDSQEERFATLLKDACSLYSTLHAQPHF